MRQAALARLLEARALDPGECLPLLARLGATAPEVNFPKLPEPMFAGLEASVASSRSSA